tara:strand:- start:1058 stop:1459 length:402 start_codon:yes stop_codon:yes gene_type:complete
MYEYKVKEVVKVVDGDTIDVVIDLGFDLSKKERVRLAGIDTPESRTRDLDEKKLGLEAKEYLSKNLTNAKQLMISTEKDGKYGRMLGTIHINDDIVSMNQQMIDKGYAWEYDGGTKEKDLNDLRVKRGLITEV